MEELRPEELEDLVQQLEGQSEEEEALSPEVEELLRDLHPDNPFTVRKKATEQLGSLGTSHQRIVSALITVQAFDESHYIRTLAAESLRAPVHQEILQEHPDLMQHARSAADQAAIERGRQREEQRETQREKQREQQKREQAFVQIPGKGETGRASFGQSASLLGCLKASAVAGLAVGFVIALWDAAQSLSHDGGLTCGIGFVIALVAGAVVGAIVGGLVQGRDDLVRGSIAGAASAGVVAAVSWFPITIVLIVQVGGP